METDVTMYISMEDEEFADRIKKLEMTELVSVISGIQAEMAKEQDTFNQLSTKLAEIDDQESPEYAAMSEHLMNSQTRLTDLMQRNMKCFTQQAANENKRLEEDFEDTSSRNQLNPDHPNEFSPDQTSESNINLVLTKTSNEPDQDIKNKNVSLKINGVNEHHNQNGGPKMVNSLFPWKTGDKKVQSEVSRNGGYKEHPLKDEAFDVKISTNSGIEKAYNDVESTAQLQEPPQSKMEPKQVSQATFTISSSKMSPEVPPSSGYASTSQVIEESEPQSELPKSGSLHGLRSMFESQGADTKSSLPRPASYDRNLKTNGANGDNNNYKAEPSKNGIQQERNGIQQERNAVTFHISPSEQPQQQQATAPQPSRQQQQSYVPPNRNESARPKGKGTWYKQVSQMASDVQSGSGRQQQHQQHYGGGGGGGAGRRNYNSGGGGGGQRYGGAGPRQESAGQQRVTMGNTNATHTSSKSSPPNHQSTAVPSIVTSPPVNHSTVDSAPADQTTKVSRTNFTVKKADNNDKPAQGSPVVIRHSQLQQQLQQPQKTTLLLSSTSSPSSSLPPPSPTPSPSSPGGRRSSSSTQLDMSSSTVSPMTMDSRGFTADDNIEERVTLKHWDPTLLLRDLYQIKLQHETSDAADPYINMEGYMEKLPMNKKKATLLKTWKRRYFKAMDGALYYYESTSEDEDLPMDFSAQISEKANGILPLNGGCIEEMDNNMIGIDDGRGRYLLVRCPNDNDYHKWITALKSQTVSNPRISYVKPVLSSMPHVDKKVLVIDLGSASCRAGILGNQASLPQVFFPTVVATHKVSGEKHYGIKALSSSIRAESNITFPIRPSTKVDKFSIDMEMMPGLLGKMFQELSVDPSQYRIMMSAPANISDKYKADFMDILIQKYRVVGVNIINQTMLALYAYGATSGIVVDIGERIEILPVTDGYIVEGGVTRQTYGGNKMTEVLNTCLTERKYRFFTDVEALIVRLVMEKMSFVSMDYDDDLTRYQEKPDEYRESISLDNYELPDGSWTHVSNDLGRFKAPEGLFQQEVWEMDNPPLQKLIQKAIQACPMDARREMWRSVYLSGGVTQVPGFESRLQKELEKVAPQSIKVEVHGSPQRYHAAYIGACALAGMKVFEQSCISADEWTQHGATSLRKWHMY